MAKKKIVIDREVIFIAVVYVMGITLVFNLWRNNFLLSSLLVLLWAINIKYWHTKSDNTLFLLGFFGGLLGEINAVQLGIWTYSNPSFAGIPLWLPLLWGETVVVTKRIAEALNQLLYNSHINKIPRQSHTFK